MADTAHTDDPVSNFAFFSDYCNFIMKQNKDLINKIGG